MTGKRQRKVLVIEGDAGTGDLILQTLSRRGLQVTLASNAEEGLLRAKETLPDLVFISLFFPNSNGLKVSKLLHSVESLKQAPVVMLIEYQGELDPKYTSAIGIVDVLVRPIKPDEIIKKTVKILGKDVLSGEASEAAGAPAGGGARELPSGLEMAADAESRDEWPSAEGVGDFGPGGNQGVSRGGEPNFGHEAGTGNKEVDETEEFLRQEPDEDVHAMEGSGYAGHEEAEKPFAGGEEKREDAPVDYEPPAGETSKKMVSKKSVILALAVFGVALVAGLGTYSIKKMFPSGGKSAQVKTASANKEVVKEAARGPVVSDEGRTKEKEKPVETKKQQSAPVDTESTQGKEAVSTPAAKQPSVSEKYKFSAQAGAFGNEKNAASLAGQLKGKGYDAFVEKDAARPIYRVLVGRFEDNRKAGEQVRTLQSAGFKSIIYRGRG